VIDKEAEVAVGDAPSDAATTVGAVPQERVKILTPKFAAGIARVARGVGGFAAAYVVLLSLSYYPHTLDFLLAGAVGIAMLLSPVAGVAVYIVAVALPLAWVNPLLAAIAVVLGFAGIGVLAENGAAWFFIIALAPIAARAHVSWTIPLLAGFYLGGVEGFVGGLLACVALELMALLLGFRTPGVIAPTIHKTLGDVYHMRGAAPGLTSLAWLPNRLLDLNVMQGTVAWLARLFTGHPSLSLQPAIWGAAGAIGGVTMDKRPRRNAIIIILLAIGIFAGMTGLAQTHLSGPRPPLYLYAAYGIASAVLALMWMVVAVRLAAAKRGIVPTPAEAAAGVGVAATAFAGANGAAAAAEKQSEQDVVELLRTISMAQDAIKEKFTQTATVLLTDMKEFSKMTHEQGSLPSAATVQRARDLLEPVIEARNGHGKPTGGDGMVAAFTSADDAIQAAMDMQRALDHYNREHPTANQILIRIGLHTGEVVFDKDSNPFIGDAMNVASRVMNLADAGQIFAGKETKEASTGAGEPQWFDHGTRKLRGIKEDVGIFEILWGVGQQPQTPRAAHL
jgi:class 3 adenylate cyclase